MSVQVLHGNNLEILPTLPDCSIDAVVTDPPYGLSKEPDATEVITHWLNGDDYIHTGGGFMGKTWDSFVPGPMLWREVFRVLKPGGHLLSFGGTRTYDLMVLAIRLAGFEIRDCITYLYGSGFPKSLDVSKAIDKRAGVKREVIGSVDVGPDMRGGNFENAEGRMIADITAPATDEAKQWEGWGTALKPAAELIAVARKPLVGTVAGNVLEWGTGALNIDASRIGTDGGTSGADAGPSNGIYGNGLNGAFGKPVAGLGRWPANVLFSHHEDCQQIGVREDTMRAGERTANFGTQETQSGGNGSGSWGSRTTSVGVWECVAGCPVAELDQQSGKLHAPGTRRSRSDRSPFSTGETENKRQEHVINDSGGASRFFYCAKPSKRERNAGLDHLPEALGGSLEGGNDKRKGDKPQLTPRANTHPTVKPLALMRYLVRLVTPPNGTVLDPFAGSGTTLMAATLENFNAVGIEMTDEYLPIIEGRVAWAEQEAQREAETKDDQGMLPL